MITRILITFIVYSFFGWLLCDISPDEEYVWCHGIWHGAFFVCNLIRSWFWDTLYKAEVYTTAYNVFYWIFSKTSTISVLFGGRANRG